MDVMSQALFGSFGFVPLCRPPINWSEFEGLAFEVLGMFMFWFAPKIEPLQQSTLYVQRSAREVMDPMMHAWLPCFNLVTMMRLERHMLQHNPHSTLGSHDEARNVGPLSSQFVSAISTLGEGEGSWFRCGGNAAIDFILVVRSEEATYSIRFIDAKHTSKASTSIPSSTTTEIVAKAKLEHAAIARKLTNHFKVLGRGTILVEPFDNCHALVIANSCGVTFGLRTDRFRSTHFILVTHST
jgi:hypothetical protein